jgi:ATP-dependent protease HslVU (ClpYQ) peptidase subunit
MNKGLKRLKIGLKLKGRKMTCIVGIVDKENNKVIIGGDSAESAGSSCSVRKDVKVFKNGEFIIGCTSSFRMIQLLRYSFKPLEIGNKDVYEYMCTDFINEVRECFKNGGYIQKGINGDEIGGTFLVAYKNRLFKIEDDFQVAENTSEMDAIGCGADFALGSIYTSTEQSIPMKEKVLKALQIAELLANGVRQPFIIEST